MRFVSLLINKKMGIFQLNFFRRENSIKKLLARRETQEKVDIKQLSKWLEVKTMLLFESLDSSIKEIINKIGNEKKIAYENLKVLENAQLQNPKIPERAKIIMEGNRSAFIKKVYQFFNNINLDFDYSINYYNILAEKCSNIINEIDALGTSTAKSYHVLNQFFAREAEKVAVNIKNIENYSNNIIDLIRSEKILNIDKIKNNIMDVQNKIKLKEQYTAELEKNKNNLNALTDKKFEIEEGINKLKSSSDYKNYEELLEENKKINKELNEIEAVLFHDFSALDRALKKYAKISFENEGIILEYLSNPIIALAKDRELEILKILDTLKNTISRNELDLDEKKREKSLAKIDELDSIYLTKIRDDFISIKKKLNDLEEKIKTNIPKKNFYLLNTELKNINQNIDEFNNKILGLNNEMGKIDVGGLIENLQNDINNALNVRVILEIVK